jgi:hypothetical protein
MKINHLRVIQDASALSIFQNHILLGDSLIDLAELVERQGLLGPGKYWIWKWNGK